MPDESVHAIRATPDAAPAREPDRTLRLPGPERARGHRAMVCCAPEPAGRYGRAVGEPAGFPGRPS